MNKSLAIVLFVLLGLCQNNEVQTYIDSFGRKVKRIVDNHFDESIDKPDHQRVVDSAHEIVQHLKEQRDQHDSKIRSFKDRLFDSIKERASEAGETLEEFLDDIEIKANDHVDKHFKNYKSSYADVHDEMVDVIKSDKEYEDVAEQAMDLIKDVKRKHYEAADLHQYNLKDKVYDTLMNVRLGAIEATDALNDLVDDAKDHVGKHYERADDYMESFLRDLKRAAKEAAEEEEID